MCSVLILTFPDNYTLYRGSTRGIGRLGSGFDASLGASYSRCHSCEGDLQPLFNPLPGLTHDNCRLAVLGHQLWVAPHWELPFDLMHLNVLRTLGYVLSVTQELVMLVVGNSYKCE